MPPREEIYEVLAQGAAEARRLSLTSASERWQRLRRRSFFIVQIAISAAVAWFVARDLLGHQMAFFAPVAAVVALGFSYGQRLQRVPQIVFGVAVGVAVGDFAVSLLGSGYWQVALIIATAMAITTFLNGSVLTTTQAGVQSTIVTILVAHPDQAMSRWIDAVVGGVVALLAATITPAAPLRRPRESTSRLVAEMATLYAETAAALGSDDLARAEDALARARKLEKSLSTLESLADDGLSVIRSSPFRRGHLPHVQEIADLLEPLARALRNLRVLVRRGTIALRQGEKVPKAYIRMVAELSEITAHMAEDLGRGDLDDRRRAELFALAEDTTYVTGRPTLSSEVIRAQVRSIILDMLMVSGLDFEEALRGIPSSYSLTGAADEIHRDDVPRRAASRESGQARESWQARGTDPRP